MMYSWGGVNHTAHTCACPDSGFDFPPNSSFKNRLNIHIHDTFPWDVRFSSSSSIISLSNVCIYRDREEKLIMRFELQKYRKVWS